MSEIVDFIANLPDRKFDTVRSELFKLGINTKYESLHPSDNDSGSSQPRRMLLYITNYAGRSLFKDLCNGIILDIDTWKPIMVPPPHIKHLPAQKNMDVKDYDVYPIIDGTTINIYKFNGKWRIATSKGWDVGHITFTNTGWTYMRLFEDVIKKVAGINSFDEFTERLDESFSYSFIITCGDIHLYWKIRTPNCAIAFIMRCNLANFNREYKWGDEKLAHLIPSQEALPQDSIPPIGILYSLYSDADITNKSYKKALLTSDAALTSLHEKCKFGLIFRSRNLSKTGDQSFACLKSPLYLTLDRCLYKHHIYSEIQQSFDRENFIILRAYLCDKSAMLQVCPQYADIYSKFDAFVAKLVSNISKLYTVEKTAYVNDVKVQVEPTDNSLEMQFKHHLDSILTINVDSVGYEKIIEADIRRPENAVILYKYIYEADD
jgi:hypothetical protein